MKTTTRLGIILAISTAFFAVEVSMGFRTKSLALIADAFHVLNDIVSFSIAFLATYVQGKGYRPLGFTYALHRAENVGAFFNGVFLLALALSIFLQSLERFINIEAVEDPLSMLIVGCVGLAMNLLSAGIVGHDHGHDHSHGNDEPEGHGHSHGIEMVTRESSLVHDEGASSSFPVAVEERNIGDIVSLPICFSKQSTLTPHEARVPQPHPHGNLGVMAVFIHLLGDAINNIGVIAAALVMWRTRSPARFYADPAVSLIISLIIFASAIPLTMRSGRILLEASPIHIDLNHITADLLSLNDVLSIHDLHVWQLSQKFVAILNIISGSIAKPLLSESSSPLFTSRCR
ncbi:hypothetical protein HWV62_44037 [Athelia sp. TMB]|nr:hypothetical protein HWV62_44037 [Athelia sp. TMB]